MANVAYGFLTRGASADLLSLVVVIESREWHGAASGKGHVGYQRKILHQKVVDMKQAAHGSGHVTELLKECFVFTSTANHINSL